MEDLDINIPLYRAEIKDNSRDEEYMKGFVKIIDDKIYVIGYYCKGHIEVTVGDTTKIFPIKKETLAINLSKRNLFMALDSLKGIGGDKISDNGVLILNDEMMNCSILELDSLGSILEYKINLDNFDFDRMRPLGVQQ